MPSVYNHIVEKSGAKITKLEYVMEVGNEEYPNEKAVEDKLVKPLLKELGYKENDYTQQMRLNVGNNNYVLIPDFVIKPHKEGGHYSGFAVIETKRSINTESEIDAVKRQVRSYANQLRATYSVVASIEGMRIMSRKDDYDKEVLSLSWNDISDKDVFYKLKKMLGNV